MLTNEQVKALFAMAMAYDNRRLSEAGLRAWAEASRRGRWTFDEAAEALNEHYATETTFVMPGHITQRIRTARQDRAMRELPAAPVVDALGQARIRELVAGALQDVPETDPAPPVAAPRPNPRLAKACPHCQAAPDQPCTRPGRAGRVPLAQTHPARQQAS